MINSEFHAFLESFPTSNCYVQQLYHNLLSFVKSILISSNVLYWCRIGVWTLKNLTTLAQWMGLSISWLEGEGATYPISPMRYPVGVFTEITTMDLSKWQRSTTHLFYLSTRRAVMGRYMILSQSQGTRCQGLCAWWLWANYFGKLRIKYFKWLEEILVWFIIQ